MQIESTAIVIHQLQTGMSHQSLSVVTHDFRQSDTGLSLGPGRVFSESDKVALARVLIDDLNTGVELLNERSLVANLETLAWFRPRGKTTICVNGSDFAVPLPSLVFFCHQGQLYVKAFKGKGRPKTSTELYSASLPNLYSDGLWCAGGNLLPSRPSQSDIEKIETMFFQSPFTHAGSEPFPAKVTDMSTWFESLQGKETYPTKALVGSGLSFGQWVSRISGAY